MTRPKTLDQLDLENKRVFLRTDYNVVKDGKIIDEFRIEASLPTIKYLLEKNCSIVLASHNGRPDGKKDLKLSLKPVAQSLSKLLDREVEFASDCVGSVVEKKAAGLQAGQLLLLENLRFYESEEKNDGDFARRLAKLAEVYVDDAFANAHRAHASMVGVPKLLPHAAGKLMQKEFDTLHGLLENPQTPFTAIIAGAKVSTKLDVLKNLLDKVDRLVIGGAMANTFVAAEGADLGKSIMEKDLFDEARRIKAKAAENGVECILPVDFVAAKKPEAGLESRVVRPGEFDVDEMALDLGPASAEKIDITVRDSRTVFWNGTLGVAEIDEFANASRQLAETLAKSQIKSIIGGGDTAAYIDKIKMHDRFSFVSTGGGASLELLAGKPMPAIEALV